MNLSDLCSHIVDCAHKTAPISDDGDYYAVGTPAMRGHRIDYGASRRINRATFNAWTERLVPQHGDLLLAREAPVGPVVQIPPEENVAPGQRTVLLRPDPSIVDSRFLYYYLISPTRQSNLLLNASGSTVPHLNVSDVRTLPTPNIPSLHKQRAIAEVLGALDDKIAANDRAVSVSEELMITHAETASKQCEISDLARQSKTSIKTGEFDDKVKLFSLPAFDQGKLPENVDSTTIKSNKFILDGPCVLFSKLNPRIPRIWDVNALPDEMSVASTEFIVLVPYELPSSLIWAALCEPTVSTRIASNVAGTSGSHQRVKPAELLQTRVRDPRTLAPQTRETIVSLGETCRLRRAESVVLAKTRDELLPLLMSGKIRVRDAERTVEEVV